MALITIIKEVIHIDHNKIIGSNIRFERQKRDLTIEELSEIINIAPGFLGLIERGQRGTSLRNLCKIADFFSITLDELIKRYIAEGSMVKEEPVIEQKRTTALSFVNTMDIDELDYLISTIKAFKKYNNLKYNKNRGNSLEDFDKDYDEDFDEEMDF